jgi:hypothetical protein
VDEDALLNVKSMLGELRSPQVMTTRLMSNLEVGVAEEDVHVEGNDDVS